MMQYRSRRRARCIRVTVAWVCGGNYNEASRQLLIHVPSVNSYFDTVSTARVSNQGGFSNYKVMHGQAG